MILSRFSKRERSLTIATITIVATVVSYGFVVEPLISSWSRLNRRIGSMSLKLERNYKLLGRGEIIEERYKRYSRYVKPLSSEEEEVASMLKEIEAMARADSVHINNIRPHPARDRGFYEDFIFEVIADADISSLVKFIYDLQNSGNLLRVKKFTLSAVSKQKDQLKIIMLINKPAVKPLTK